jgi:hypothetical protein
MRENVPLVFVVLQTAASCEAYSGNYRDQCGHPFFSAPRFMVSC